MKRYIKFAKNLMIEVKLWKRECIFPCMILRLAPLPKYREIHDSVICEMLVHNSKVWYSNYFNLSWKPTSMLSSLEMGHYRCDYIEDLEYNIGGTNAGTWLVIKGRCKCQRSEWWWQKKQSEKVLKICSAGFDIGQRGHRLKNTGDPKKIEDTEKNRPGAFNGNAAFLTTSP